MTPSDIATTVSSSSNVGTINASTNFTQSAMNGGFVMDDANTWD